MFYLILASTIYFTFNCARELYKIYSDIKKGLYISGDKMHSIEHMFMIGGFFSITWSWFITQLITDAPNPTIIAFNMFICFFVVKHLKDERRDLTK